MHDETVKPPDARRGSTGIDKATRILRHRRRAAERKRDPRGPCAVEAGPHRRIDGQLSDVELEALTEALYQVIVRPTDRVDIGRMPRDIEGRIKRPYA